LLTVGGVFLVGFTYFMGHESVWPQAVMTGVLAFSMFLILTLNRPYSGAARVTPQPFLLELAHVASRMPK
jgi:hypothetical protein